MATDEWERAIERPANFKKPVGWLLGADLFASLRGFLVYYLCGPQMAPKDWREACAFDHTAEAEGGELWFDYIADAGDGQTAMYSLAWLLQGDLWLGESGAVRAREGGQRLE